MKIEDEMQLRIRCNVKLVIESIIYLYEIYTEISVPS